MNIMLDLETMGNGPDAAIIAIGACKFDITGIQDTYYCVVDLTSSLNAGLKVDGDTILWWLKQSDDARKAIHSPLTSANKITEALETFACWVEKNNQKNPKIWGNGASFDNVILANAYGKVGLETPWKYYNDRCYRTIKAMYPEIKMNRKGTHHNALDDAISQAEHLIKIWEAMP